MKACPSCAEQIQDAAVICRFCNRPVTPTPPAATGPGTVEVRSGAVTAFYALVAIIGAAVVLTVLVSVQRAFSAKPTPTTTTAAASPAPAPDPTPAPPPHTHDSDAAAAWSVTQLTLTNTGKEAWTDARITLNPSGLLRRGYEAHTGPMAPKRKITAGLATLVDGDGKRFNPFEYTVQEAAVRVTFADGHTAYYTFHK